MTCDAKKTDILAIAHAAMQSLDNRHWIDAVVRRNSSSETGLVPHRPSPERSLQLLDASTGRLTDLRTKTFPPRTTYAINTWMRQVPQDASIVHTDYTQYDVSSKFNFIVSSAAVGFRCNATRSENELSPSIVKPILSIHLENIRFLC
jgi:hypothetical protein